LGGRKQTDLGEPTGARAWKGAIKKAPAFADAFLDYLI